MPQSDDVFEYCAYWEPLYYLLTTILGWRDLAQGLAWWYAHGRPTDDPRLAFMQTIWDNERQLAFFAAWGFQEGHANFTLDDAASTSAYRDADWWHDFRRLGHPFRHDPFHGGTNALHLGHSEWAWALGDATPDSLHVDAARRHVVLITHDFTTWRGELVNAGRTLPPLADDRSWHVDVFDKRVGWLGSYRQSRVTGRWFAGKHSLHMAGQ